MKIYQIKTLVLKIKEDQIQIWLTIWYTLTGIYSIKSARSLKMFILGIWMPILPILCTVAQKSLSGGLKSYKPISNMFWGKLEYIRGIIEHFCFDFAWLI